MYNIGLILSPLRHATVTLSLSPHKTGKTSRDCNDPSLTLGTFWDWRTPTAVAIIISKGYSPMTCIGGGLGGIIITGWGTGGGGALAMATIGLFTACDCELMAGGAGTDGGGGGCFGGGAGLGGGGGGTETPPADFGAMAGPIFSFSASGLKNKTIQYSSQPSLKTIITGGLITNAGTTHPNDYTA